MSEYKRSDASADEAATASADQYPTPSTALATTLGETPEQAEAKRAEVQLFQNRQVERATELREKVKRQSNESLTGSAALRLFGKDTEKLDAMSRRFSAGVRQEEQHEIALIDYAIKEYINLSDPDWRTKTLEHLARSHPEIKPKPQQGRPKKGQGKGGLLSASPSKLGTVEELIRLPGKAGVMPLGEFIKMIDTIREEVAALLEKNAPRMPARSRNSDRMVAVSICVNLYPQYDEKGLRPKIKAWQDVISKARGMMAKI